MKGWVKKLLITLVVIAAFAVIFVLLNLKPIENYSEKYAGVDLNADVEGAIRKGTYTRYLSAHADAAYPTEDISVDLFAYTEGEEVEVYKDFEGEDKALYTGAKSTVTWEVDAPQAGFYNVYLEYMTVESRGVAIERAIYINGELPFDDAGNIVFTRIWTDKTEPKVDNQGNQIRPAQVEIFDWQSAYCRDDMGYELEPYQFYLKKG